MIVWSKGLGKQRLPLKLADAELKLEPGYMLMTGVVEPVCWDYAIRLAPGDIAAFLRLAAQPATARYLAQRPGLIGPLVLGLLAQLPALVALLAGRALGLIKQEVA